MGENHTSQGVFSLDRAGAESVMASFEKKGVDLAIDYEHQTFAAKDNGKPAPAAGWFKPEARADGIWATNVKWTDPAAAMLKAKEYRYFSPTFRRDSKNRILELRPMALTNDPASHGIEALVAASETIALAEWSTAMMDNLPDSAFLHVEAGGKKVGGKTEPLSLRHFPVRGPDGKIDMAHLRNALSRIPQSNLPASVKNAATAEAHRLMPKTEMMNMKNLASIVGLKDDAPEEDVESRVVALSRTEVRLLEITGKDNVGDAIGMVIAAKDSSVRLAAAEKSLHEWEERDARDKQELLSKQIATLVDSAVLEGRVSLRDTEKVRALTSQGEIYGIECLKNTIALLPARPVRVYQSPTPANVEAAQMAAVAEYKRSHPEASTGDAFVALAAKTPALFPEYAANGGNR
jgi:hypothetical protein